MSGDLRDRVADVIDRASVPRSAADVYAVADAVLVVFAERERELRARIEALRAAHDPLRRGGGPHSYTGAIDDVLAVFDEAVPEVVDKPVCSCGDLSWTVRYYGRVTHKEACRFRTDPWSQSYPRRGDDDEAVPDGEEAR